MQLIRQTRRLAKLELLLVFSKTQWLLTVGVVALIPALYLLIYLSSMWDTTSHTRALRIGLVNQDKGYTYRDQFVEMGTELVHQLMRKDDFGYYPLASPELAREQVRRGELAFALIIPADFSASAIPARSADEGRMEIYVSAGNNFQIYLIAQKYAEELDAELNQALNQQRWKFVLSSEVISKDFFELKSALSKIQKSTHDLSLGLHTASLHGSRLKQGTLQLGDEINKLTSITQQLSQMIHSIEAGLPPADDVRRLRVGADELASAHLELDKALGNLHAGSLKLSQGVEQFKRGELGIPFFSNQLEEAIKPLQTGLLDLSDGLSKVQVGHKQITGGAETVRDSVRTLAFGVRDMRAALRQIVVKIPDNQQLAQWSQSVNELSTAQGQLDQGLKKLSDGSVFLDSSTQWMLNRIPTQIDLIDGSPEGLAHSVISELKVVSPVRHLGAAMVPNIIPVALWLGAGVAIFLIRGRQSALIARRYSNAAKLLAKASVPAMVVSLQSMLIVGLISWGFDLRVENFMATVALIWVAAMSFVFVLLFFVRLMGDLGKALAMLLLALQISASGGVVPVELSSEFFAALSPWLPMTWIVQGLKAAMFNAYEGNWLYPLIQTGGLWLVCGLLAMGVGRWHYSRISHSRPVLDL